jgi:acyl-CoA thioesterase-1
MLQLLIGCGSADEQAVSTDRQERSVNAPGKGSDAEAVSAASAKILVVAFGDSLYAGYGLGPSEGFVPELQAALRAKGFDAYVHNAGVSGDTTAAGERRLAFVLDSLPRSPDLVVLGLGGNDMLRGIGPDQTRANLTKMLTELGKRKIRVLLTGMLAPANLGEEYSQSFNAIFPQLAKAHDAALYPFFLDGLVGKAALFQADRIHPTAEGIDVIVERIAPVVAVQLPKAPQ